MILSLLLAGMGTVATAQNINLPIIQTKYTADPALPEDSGLSGRSLVLEAQWQLLSGLCFYLLS